ncbi:MAG: magnesium transporter, partial [Sedimentisphaerales bacterium]|nr:magnesium transporter [Sedimentisphaerales bacterium]
MAFLFAPMIGAISGNAGLQTSAIVVCGLATGDLAALRIGQVFLREVRVALLVAVCCGIIGGLICAYLPKIISPQLDQEIQAAANAAQADPASTSPPHSRQQKQIAIALGSAMFSAIMVSTTLGLLLPFVFRRIGLDPAISSGPLVTTANDSISVAIYMLLTILLTR